MMRFGKTAVLVLAGITTWTSAAPSALAGPLCDWLFHRFRRCPAAAPFAVASCGVMPQPVLTGYVPQTHYRTTWMQVPVTTYRPVQSFDPRTNCPVTAMQPCTTFTWQAQRTPYTVYQPVYAMQQAPIAAAAAGCAPGMVLPQSAAPAYHTPGMQGYQVPAGQGYQVPAGQGYQVPGMPGYPAGTAPGPATLVPSPDGGATTVPADQPPSLSPSHLQGGSGVPNPAGIQYGNMPNVQGSATTGTGAAGMFPSPTVAPGATSSTLYGQPREAVPNSGGQQPGSSTQSYLRELRPIPDPETRRPSAEPAAPQLLNPRDRTAGLPVRQAAAYTPIVWSQPAAEPQPAAAPQAPRRRATDTGWRSTPH